MPYVIHKTSRMPAQVSYNGRSCANAGVTGGQVYSDKRKALADARKLSDHNPCGFVVSKQPDSEPLPFDLDQKETAP